jgi:hypothetical protein
LYRVDERLLAFPGLCSRKLVHRFGRKRNGDITTGTITCSDKAMNWIGAITQRSVNNWNAPTQHPSLYAPLNGPQCPRKPVPKSVPCR